MGIVQSTYTDRPAIGIPGDLVYPARDNAIVSRIAEVAIANALCLTQGTLKPNVSPYINPGQCKIPTSEAEVTAAMGIAIRNRAQEGSGYAIGDTVSILRKGQIFVETESGVAYDGAVYVRVTAGVGEVAGAFRHNDDAGDAFVLPGAKFKMATSGAGLTIVEIDL